MEKKVQKRKQNKEKIEKEIVKLTQDTTKKNVQTNMSENVQKTIQRTIQKERTISYYNENAEAFCEGTRFADMSETRGRFLRYVQPGGLILDAGCGSGRDSKYFLEHGYRVVAMDASEEICRLASEYLGQVVECRRFEGIAETEKYDGIWACASLLHVPYTELPEMIARLVKALVDGGVLYASFKYGREENETVKQKEKIEKKKQTQAEQIEKILKLEERESGGRYFTDLTEDGWKKVMAEAERYMEEFRIKMVECFVTGDIRKGREEEKWLNVVGRKVNKNEWQIK